MYLPLKTSENDRFCDDQGVGRTTFDPKWVNNLIKFQEIDVPPYKDWSNSKMSFTSDKGRSK